VSKRTTPGVLALTAGLLLVAPPSGAEEPPGTGDVEAIRDQAIHYMRIKMYPAAQKKLEEAAALPGGAEDFKTQHNLAKVYYKQLILEQAFPAARRAVEVAESDREEKLATKLLKRMEDFFAGVTLQQAPEQVGQVEKGFVHLEDAGGLINRKKKEAFEKIRQRFKDTQVKLPLTIYLPFGSYTANLAPFEIRKGETAEATMFLYVPDTEGLSVWWYVGGGIAAAVAATTATLLLLGDDEPAPRAVRVTGVKLTEPGQPDD